MTDQSRLEKIEREVEDYLRSRCASMTPRNIIQAMFMMHYADWLGGSKELPICCFQQHSVVSPELQAIEEKCEQYWNELGVWDTEWHAVLEFIHDRCQSLRRKMACGS